VYAFTTAASAVAAVARDPRLHVALVFALAELKQTEGPWHSRLLLLPLLLLLLLQLLLHILNSVLYSSS